MLRGSVCQVESDFWGMFDPGGCHVGLCVSYEQCYDCSISSLIRDESVQIAVKYRHQEMPRYELRFFVLYYSHDWVFGINESSQEAIYHKV